MDVHILYKACCYGNKELVNILVNNYGYTNYNEWMVTACAEGYMNIVKLMIKKGATAFRKGILTACENGYIDIMQYIVDEKGDWLDAYDVLKVACRQGHMNIVNLLIDNEEWYESGWQNGLLTEACEGGYIEIVNLIIEKGASDWNEGLCCACEGGHTDIVKLMIEKGAIDWNGGLEYACRGGHTDIVKLMIEKGADEWRIIFENACYYGDKDMVLLMLERKTIVLDHGLLEVCRGYAKRIMCDIKRIDFVNFIDTELRDIMRSWLHTYMDIAKLLIERGAVSHFNSFSTAQKRYLLNLNIEHKYVIHNDAFNKIITKRTEKINAFKIEADNILHGIYKDKQIYDKNVINLITQYVPY